MLLDKSGHEFESHYYITILSTVEFESRYMKYVYATTVCNVPDPIPIRKAHMPDRSDPYVRTQCICNLGVYQYLDCEVSRTRAQVSITFRCFSLFLLHASFALYICVCVCVLQILLCRR